MDRVEPNHRIAKTLSSGDCSAIQRANRTQARVEAEDACVACSSAAMVLSHLMQCTRTFSCSSTCPKCNNVLHTGPTLACSIQVENSACSMSQETLSQGCPVTGTTSTATWYASDLCRLETPTGLQAMSLAMHWQSTCMLVHLPVVQSTRVTSTAQAPQPPSPQPSLEPWTTAAQESAKSSTKCHFTLKAACKYQQRHH